MGSGDDPVGFYAGLLASGLLSDQALCLTVVRGCGVDEAITGYDGFTGGEPLTLPAAGAAGQGVYPDLVPIVVAGDCGGWTVLAEDNGWHGSGERVLARLSAGGGVAASVYWNVNRVTRIGYAVDGRWLASFDYVCTSWSGPRPDRLAAFLDGLPLDDPERSDAAALAVLERISGVRIGAEWLTQPHQTSVVVPATVFEPDCAPRGADSPGGVEGPAGSPVAAGVVKLRAA